MVKINLSLLNCSGAFIIKEVIMKNWFVPGLYFVSLTKLIILMLITHFLITIALYKVFISCRKILPLLSNNFPVTKI